MHYVSSMSSLRCEIACLYVCSHCQTSGFSIGGNSKLVSQKTALETTQYSNQINTHISINQKLHLRTYMDVASVMSPVGSQLLDFGCCRVCLLDLKVTRLHGSTTKFQ